jgi:hypothetical protein
MRRKQGGIPGILTVKMLVSDGLGIRVDFGSKPNIAQF